MDTRLLKKLTKGSKDMLKKSLFLLPAVMLAMTIHFSIPVSAATHTFNTSNEYSTCSADKIVLKTRTYNGKLQYRHWNETKHCWVESHWIDF